MNAWVLAAACAFLALPLAAQQPVKVGVIAPFTGPFADYGRQFEAGIRAWQKLNGDHGVSRPSIPARSRVEQSRPYPFGWFAILVEAPLASDELIDAHHERGFALVSTRSPTLQRLYFPCDPAEDAGAWSDDRIWAELHARLATRDGWTFTEGRIRQKAVVAMRSLACETMRHGRLFLAAVLAAFYATGTTDRLDACPEEALRRIWWCEHFSCWMTSLLHRFPDEDGFHHRLQQSQLEYVTRSRAAATSLAENYVCLPWDWTHG